MMLEDQPDQFRIPVPGGPMERRAAMLTACIDRQSRSEHQAGGDGVVVPCGMCELTAAVGGERCGEVWMLLEQSRHQRFIVDPAGVDQLLVQRTRSEERRVGKECRSRW